MANLSNFTEYNSSLLQLISMVVQALSSLLQVSTQESNRGAQFMQQLQRMHHLVLCGSILVERQASFCSALDAESIEMSIGHVSRLAFVVQSLVHVHLEGNAFLCSALTGSRLPTTAVDQSIM